MKLVRTLPAWAAAACLSAGVAAPALATTYVVNDPGEDTAAGQISLREAITAANSNAAFGDAEAGDVGSGDVINLAVNVTLTDGEIEISEGVTINLNGRTVTQNSTEARIFTVSGDDVVINNGTLTGGDPSMGDGGAIFNSGELALTDVTVTGNTATAAASNGGGIASTGEFTMTRGSLTNNTANRAGGGFENTGGTATFTDVTITNNMATGGSDGEATETDGAPGNGGGIHSSPAETSDLTVLRGSVSGNTAGREGGGIWAGGESLIDSVSITNNIALGTGAATGGGGLFNQGGSMVVSESTITGNTAVMGSGSGGGILNNAGGSLSVLESTVSNNVANRAGGGLEDNGGDVTLVDVVMENNNAGVAPDATMGMGAPGNGGAVHGGGGGDFFIAGGTFRNNVAASEGGGIWTSGPTEIAKSLQGGTLITGNTASGDPADDGGGGLFNQGGDMSVMGATITDNVADGTAGSGGGILNNGGSLSVRDSTVSSNTANRAGGALEDRAADGTTFITNVVMNNNAATGGADGEEAGTDSAPGNGGAIHITGGSDMDIFGANFTGNVAGREGGALWNDAGAMNVVFANISNNSSNGGLAADDGGGGVFNNGGELNIERSDISNNRALNRLGSGGGLLNVGGTVFMEEVNMVGNRSARAGGAIEDNAGSGLTVLVARMVGNETIGDGDSSPGNGGAIHMTGGGAATLAGIEFADNFAANEGGALWNHPNSTMSVAVSTLSANRSPAGSAIYQEGNGTGVSIGDSTIAFNRGGEALEMGLAQSASMMLNNSIVANNAGGNIAGGDVIGNFNVVTGDVAVTGTNNVATDPNLGRLANNGGPTRTHAIADGPALNNADSTTCGMSASEASPFPRDFDQRGFSRDPNVNNCDIGAFELVDAATATARSTAGGDTTAEPGDLVAALSFGFSNPAAATAPLVVDGFSGEVNAGSEVIGAVDSLRVFLDSNGNGEVDSGEQELTDASVDVSPAGGRFEIDLGSDEQTIAAGASVNFVLAVEITDDQASTNQLSNTMKFTATPAGMFLLPLMLLVPLWRRARALLVAGLVMLGMAACGGGSGSPGTGNNNVDADTLQFRLTEVSATSNDEPVITDGLPVDGRRIRVIERTQDDR